MTGAGLYCLRCGEAFDGAGDRAGAVDAFVEMCGPRRDLLPVTPRADIVCLVGPDGAVGPDAVADRCGHLRITALADIDEPDCAAWNALAAELAAQGLDPRTAAALRELMLRAWQAGASGTWHGDDS